MGIDVNRLRYLNVTLAGGLAGFGGAYLAVAVVVNAWFIGSTLRLIREQSEDAARRTFRVSLAYLFSLLLAMNFEVLTRF